MKNIHILPTDKPSKLSDCHNNNLHLNDVRYLRNYQNIFITSNEKLPYDSTIFHTGAFYHIDFGGDVHIINKDTHYPNPNFCSRIILTTDESLFKYGVQAIDDEFLEWFVKNPSCERVEIERVPFYIKGDYQYHINKIIIPKTRQQVIDEDFAGGLDMGQIIPKEERTYTEEDVKNAFLDGWQLRDGDLPFPKAKKKWFNEFKNK